MSWVKFAAGFVGQPLVDRNRTIPPSNSFNRTRLGHIAARDLQRYYAALEYAQREVPVNGDELRLICRALPAPISNPSAWVNLHTFWQRVEQTAHEGGADGVDVDALVKRLREAAPIHVAAIVDLAERERARAEGWAPQ
jgi:hypothetical protein